MLTREMCLCEQEELFQRSGVHSELVLIRDCLDTGTPDNLCIFCLSLHLKRITIIIIIIIIVIIMKNINMMKSYADIFL